MGLVLLAAGLVLAAPLLGRAGAPRLASATMATAAVCGVASFALAAAHTLRAARRDVPRAGPAGQQRTQGRDA